MTRRAGTVLLLWVLAILAAAWVVAHSRYNADMSFFLPSEPTPGQQVMVDQLKEGAVSRLLMVAIEGGDETGRAAFSGALRQRLQATDLFVSVQNGETGSQDAEREYLMRHRYLLSPEVSAERFTVEGLKSAIGNSIELLASPAGMMLKTLLPRDPTGELWAQVQRLDAGAEPDSVEGVWASRDGQRALLLLQTRAVGSDTDGQAQAIEAVRAAFDAERQATSLSDARLLISGPGLFAVNARATIKEEVSRLSLIGTTGIVLVLLFVYRSPRLLALGLLPVVSGALAGIVAVSLVFGTVYGITIGFGMALIGEAVDYAIYYFVQSGPMGAAAWRQRFWPTVRLGVLTSVAGFGALLLSGFPGLAQLGLYALTGVLVAALTTRFVLPELAPQHLRGRDLTGVGKGLLRGFAVLRHARWAVLALAALALGYLVSERHNLWKPDIAVLSPASVEDLKVNAALSGDMGAPDARYMVVVSAADADEALRLAEQAAEPLDRLVSDGVIGSYDNPARFLPSTATQRERQAALPDAAVLRERLGEALTGAPLAAASLEPFLADVATARSQPLLDRAALGSSGLGLLVDSLLVQRAGGWSVLLPLHAPMATEEGESTGIDGAAVQSALKGTPAQFVDLKTELDSLYDGYLSEAVWLSLAGVGVIVLLLGTTLRSPVRLAGVLLPLVLAVLFVIAGLHLAGETLHLLHLVGLLLVVAVGSNYGLFFDRKEGEGDMEPSTVAAMGLANFTTTIGFGVLGFSTVPVLHAMGVTVGPGAVLVLLLAAMFKR
jgi:predicted exporter